MNNETLLKRVIRVKKAVSAEDLEEKVAAAALALYAEKPILTTSEKAEKRKAAKVAKTEAMEVEESSSKSSVRKNKRLDAVPLKNMLKIGSINFLENENGTFKFKNELSIAPRILRKKIKKLAKKGVTPESAFKRVQHLVKTRHMNN